jgi:hypothetical protein
MSEGRREKFRRPFFACRISNHFFALTSSQDFDPLMPSRNGGAAATSFGEKKMS